ncbi:MAG: adenylyltransferase/cytidyltransferase family protein [Clostridia bacterium]|nr:adenylyltransferase/cytidyltransferase family protein [Clostridia bacterium]
MKITNHYLNKTWDLQGLLTKYHVTFTLEEIMKTYNHHSRFYHNFEHIRDMLKNIEIDDDALVIGILFHDIIYDGKIEHHEAESAAFFRAHCNGEEVFINIVESLIKATAYIKQELTELEKEIIRVDRSILYKTDINSLLTWEDDIFKEYQHLSINDYKEGRKAFLNYAFEETGNHTLLELRDIVVQKVYKIGFYPGSFNPFHIGHYNILQKAEKSFDKVVIGVGINYDKKDLQKTKLPDVVRNREIVFYSGLITTEIQRLKEHGEVFVVRGLRNAYDLQHEEGLRNVIKDFLPNQEFVYYFCDKEYEHISSSLIRDIMSRGQENGMASKMIERYTFKEE